MISCKPNALPAVGPGEPGHWLDLGVEEPSVLVVEVDADDVGEVLDGVEGRGVGVGGAVVRLQVLAAQLRARGVDQVLGGGGALAAVHQRARGAGAHTVAARSGGAVLLLEVGTTTLESAKSQSL